MAQPTQSILLIEDNPGDAELVKAALTDSAFQVYWAEALLPGLDRLARGDIDLVLLDVSLPDSHGLDGLTAVHTHSPGTPVVMLTGWDSESLASRAVQSGAQDYLVKGTLQGPALTRALQHAIIRHRAQGESRRDSPQEKAVVVGFLGAKGGVGGTTIACHAALELKRQVGGRILLADLDTGSNAISFLMDVRAPYSIIDATADILHLDEDRWSKLTASDQAGIDIIQSGGPAIQEDKLPQPERVRFVLRFIRSLYRWIVVDLGRLNPLSIRLAADVDRLYLVTTCDILGLSEAKAAVQIMCQSGFERERLQIILNHAPARRPFSAREVEVALGASVEAMLPECHQDFEDSVLDGKRLGESRKFQKHLAELVRKFAPTPASATDGETRPSLAMRVFQNVTSENRV